MTVARHKENKKKQLWVDNTKPAEDRSNFPIIVQTGDRVCIKNGVRFPFGKDRFAIADRLAMVVYKVVDSKYISSHRWGVPQQGNG